MDVVKAVELGLLINEVYKIPPNDLTNSAGKALTIGTTAYTVATTVYANDLATGINPRRAEDRVSIGLICQASGTGDVVIALRGTRGLLEWLHDVDFLLVPCPFLVGAGRTEDGFTAMYTSLRTGPTQDSPTVVSALGALPFPRPVSSVTMCGYSMGGALATLLALDVAANTVFNHPAAYSYASPRTGDSLFASTYNQVVTDSHRIENRLDIVPKLPPPPVYQHVLDRYELNPQLLVEHTLACEHALATYLHLLSLQSGGPVVALDSACRPAQTLL